MAAEVRAGDGCSLPFPKHAYFRGMWGPQRLLFLEIALVGCCFESLYSSLSRRLVAVLYLQLLLIISCFILITTAFPFYPSRHSLF